MSNYAYMSNYVYMPKDMWVCIFSRLVNRNKYGESTYDLKSIQNLMLVNQKFYEIIKSDLMWERFCYPFSDFPRLRFMHDDCNISWYEVFKRRLLGVWKTELIKVGNQQNPEDFVLFQILGNGQAYISIDWFNPQKIQGSTRNVYMGGNNRGGNQRRGGNRSSLTRHIIHGPNQYILSPISETKTPFHALYKRAQDNKGIRDKILGAIPFTEEGRANKELRHVIKHVEHSSFVDISSYSPFVLLLSHYGEVFEFMFLPRAIDYAGQFTPHQILFTKEDSEGNIISMMDDNEKIVYIKCTPVGNYAVSNKGKVFAWTGFDHPVTMKKIATKPVLLPMQFNIRNIVQENDQYTIFYYIKEKQSRSTNNKADMSDMRNNMESLKISNEELFFLMIQNDLN